MSILAQQKQVVLNHFGISQGFTAKEALSIAQTKNGVLWIASNHGLVKYDSRSFHFFYHNAKDTTSISNNYCNKVIIDKRDNLWIVTGDDVDIFNTQSETCQHVKVFFEGKPNQSVRPKYFCYDSIKDIMWVGTRQGLYYSKNGKLPLQNIRTFSNDSILFKENIATIALGLNNQLWITHKKYLIELNTNSGKTKYTAIPNIIDGIDNGGDAGNLLCSYLDKHNTLWFGTWCRDLISCNTIDKKFHQYIITKKNPSQDNTIPSITQTNFAGEENILWLSTYGFGLTAFDINTKKFSSFKSEIPNDPKGINGNLYGLYFNKDILWIGSQTGLHCYDKNRQIFKNISLKPIANGVNLLPVSNMAIEKNNQRQDEKLWLYIPYKNGYIYNLKTNKIENIPPKINKFIAPPNQMFDWYMDAQNILWLSTVEHGLISYNIVEDKIEIPPKKYFFDTWDWVTCFLNDKHKGLWLGTYKGLFHYNASTKQILPIAKLNTFFTKNKYATAIMDITQDDDNNLWMTVDNSDSKNACIIKYNIKSEKIVVMYDEHKESLAVNPQVELRSIKYDKHGKVFVVFFTENIQWCNTSSNVSNWNNLENKHGLNSSYIDNLLVDFIGQIWVNNPSGIASLNPTQNIVSDYNMTDYGLNTINNPSIYLSPNSNILYVGQSNNISFINIDSITTLTNLPVLIVNNISINDTVIKRNLQEAEHFIFEPRQNKLSIDFALLSFTNSDQNTYAWQLSGIDNDWVYSKTSNPVYANLAPGNYTLTLKAANSKAQWTKPFYVFIKIKAPIYARWWFMLGVILLVASFVWYIFNLRINRIKERFLLRNKIASDLHDEIGSTLTSISILSDVSQQAMDRQPTQAKEMLAQISTQSKTIQQNMSDIVWSIRPDNDKIEDLIVRMREYASYTLEPNNIITNITADETISIKSMDISFRKDILLIYKEAINNIAKHANATLVKVRFTNGNKMMKMIIQDNGTWKGNNSGTGTKTMNERAKALGGSLQIHTNESGTEIRLNIPIP